MSSPMKKYYEKNSDKLKKSVSICIIRKRLQTKYTDENNLATIANLIYYMNLSSKILPENIKQQIKKLKVEIQGKQIKNRRTKKQIEEEKAAKQIDTVTAKVKGKKKCKFEEKIEEQKNKVEEKKLDVIEKTNNTPDKPKEDTNNINLPVNPTEKS